MTENDTLALRQESYTRLIYKLDRVIVVLMVAILLVLSGPVCMVVWQQSHPASERTVAYTSFDRAETDSGR